MKSESAAVTFQGITPYLYYEDAATMIEWLTRVFGFVEIARYADSSGQIHNAEFRVGEGELWIDGYPGYWASRGRQPEQWIGVWVNDVDAMHARVTAAGVASEPPIDRPHGVRELKVVDPQGYVWGFLQRL